MSERDEQVAQDYMDGMTVPALANEHGLSESRIWQILDDKGVSGSSERMRVRREPSEPKPLSEVHEILGRRLSEFELDRLIDTKELSRRLNWSKNKLTAMETPTQRTLWASSTRTSPWPSSKRWILMNTRI